MKAPSQSLTPKINTNIDDLVAKIKEEDAAKKAASSDFSVSEIEAIFQKKKADTTSPTLKSALENSQIKIEGDAIIVRTPADIFGDLIKQDLDLLTFIHESYPDRDLSFKFMTDRAAFPDYEPPKKTRMLSTIEKYEVLKKKNPDFEYLVDAFKLKPS